MRIAYFANSEVPSRQANAVHVVNMAAALAALGHEVTLYAYIMPFEGQRELPTSAQIASYYGVLDNFHLASFREWRILGGGSISALVTAFGRRYKGCDLVIGRHAKACALAALAGQPTVFELHAPVSWYPWVDAGLLRFTLRRRAYRALITISNPLRDILLEETGWCAERLFVAHDAAPSIDSVTPAKLGGRGRSQVGYVGHLYKGRGIDIIVGLAGRMPEIDFHVIGGEETDIKYWRVQAGDLSNLHFAGFLEPARAAATRLACDILLAPYQADVSVQGGRSTVRWMSPLKIFEYMAAGKAFIASDFPVLREVLHDGENCLLVPAADINAWETALRKLVTSSSLRDRLGENAFHDFKTKYCWQQRAENILSFAFQNDVKRF